MTSRSGSVGRGPGMGVAAVRRRGTARWWRRRRRRTRRGCWVAHAQPGGGPAERAAEADDDAGGDVRAGCVVGGADDQQDAGEPDQEARDLLWGESFVEPHSGEEGCEEWGAVEQDGGDGGSCQVRSLGDAGEGENDVACADGAGPRPAPPCAGEPGADECEHGQHHQPADQGACGGDHRRAGEAERGGGDRVGDPGEHDGDAQDRRDAPGGGLLGAFARWLGRRDLPAWTTHPATLTTPLRAPDAARKLVICSHRRLSIY